MDEEEAKQAVEIDILAATAAAVDARKKTEWERFGNSEEGSMEVGRAYLLCKLKELLCMPERNLFRMQCITGGSIE